MKREKLASSHRGPRLWEPWRAFEDFEHLGNHRVGAEKEEANIDRRRRLHSCRRTNKQKQYHWKFGAKPDSIASNTPIRAVHSKCICQQKKLLDFGQWNFEFNSSPLSKIMGYLKMAADVTWLIGGWWTVICWESDQSHDDYYHHGHSHPHH